LCGRNLTRQRKKMRRMSSHKMEGSQRLKKMNRRRKRRRRKTSIRTRIRTS
jgi:hypothetical protein